jgi:hypothetical protein
MCVLPVIQDGYHRPLAQVWLWRACKAQLIVAPVYARASYAVRPTSRTRLPV